ncbi:MAG TPA: hypothetical protein DIW46_12070 [Microbacterium sp.]|nr:hypothetical protein [Microbacterium sp.]
MLMQSRSRSIWRIERDELLVLSFRGAWATCSWRGLLRLEGIGALIVVELRVGGGISPLVGVVFGVRRVLPVCEHHALPPSWSFDANSGDAHVKQPGIS